LKYNCNGDYEVNVDEDGSFVVVGVVVAVVDVVGSTSIDSKT
jgi:hypothetical protein